ncbi:MAG: beta-ketoacyl-[acyl-carrier-protein] synthase family protein [Deltaproteobacteria bacterium]|nr:beta-ketoacyl-[acyl-carrier-protein] synthase family protein [Deltaproteobacteria bacterium]
MLRKVAITGRGLLTAAGSELYSVWQSLFDGTCFIAPLQRFSCTNMADLWGGEVSTPLCDLSTDNDKQVIDHIAAYGRCTKLALIATKLALTEAQLINDTKRRAPIGVIIGTTMGEEESVGELNDHFTQIGYDAVDATFYQRADNHHITTNISRYFSLTGPSILCTAACSSGNAAIALAYDMIASGRAELMVAGGADTLTRTVYSGFSRLGILAKSVCRPFDLNRDGVCFGEGAGILVLEDYEHARTRGANIIAEIAGYGMSNDAYHVTAPEPQGDGFTRAMRKALQQSNTSFSAIEYISAHGTGTIHNDNAETSAIKNIFGEHAYKLSISSLKSMLGHCNGAASAIAAIICTLALQHQAVPPTANLTTHDPKCDLDYVPIHGRNLPLNNCLNLSAGFGGFNVCLIIKRCET